MLQTVGSQGSSIQQGNTRIRSLNLPVTCSARNVNNTRGINAGRGKYVTHLKCPCMVECIQHQSSQRLMVFPGSNNDDIDDSVSKPTHQLPVDPKVAKLLWLCKDEDATLGPPKMAPTPPRSPLMPPIPFWFSTVITLQLTVFIQLKHSFSIVVSNSHHFTTDHLHAVKMLIFYHHHFQLSSLCNKPSSGVCQLYNIPSSGVKGTSAVLCSSANFCSISQNMDFKAPVASQQ